MRSSQNVDDLVSNRYDHFGRRVQKIMPEATHIYFYDGWLLIKESRVFCRGVVWERTRLEAASPWGVMPGG